MGARAEVALKGSLSAHRPTTEQEVACALRGLSERVVAERVTIALGRAIARAASWRDGAGRAAIDEALSALRGVQ